MDLKDKVIAALFQELKPEYVRLADEDGISGFVVSRQFDGMSALDRQERIEDALSNASLTLEERRQILMIAGLTPEEYEAVGARIRVNRVKEITGGAVEVLLHGNPSDAAYVRGMLQNQEGVQKTTEPTPVPGARGDLMSFRASGTKTNPLNKERAIRILKEDPYIEVMPNA
jgi:hypothetical protein